MTRNDYDPKKAHEYYMKHRKLKGRHSMKGMTQQQRERWIYERDKIKAGAKADRDKVTSSTRQEIAKRSAEAEALREKVKKERLRFKAEAQRKITFIQERLKCLSPEKKKIFKEKLRSQISQIRDDTSSKNSALTAFSKAETAKRVAANKNTRSKAKQKKVSITVKKERALDVAYKRVRGR